MSNSRFVWVIGGWSHYAQKQRDTQQEYNPLATLTPLIWKKTFAKSFIGDYKVLQTNMAEVREYELDLIN